jgi:hypothetical protein
VDFLLGDEAFVHHAGGIVTMAAGVPLEVDTVDVDPISIAPADAHLIAAVDSPHRTEGIPVAPLEAIVYMKLRSPRRRDTVDVIELLKAGADAARVRAYLEANAADLVGRYDKLVIEAESES